MNTTQSEVGCIYKYGTIGLEESCVERTDYKLYENFQLHRVLMLQTVIRVGLAQVYVFVQTHPVHFTGWTLDHKVKKKKSYRNTEY